MLVKGLPDVKTKKVTNWYNLIYTFIVGQGIAQFIQVLSGFFIIRWLSVEDYAQFSMAFAFLSTAAILVNFEFPNAIIALVGGNIQDKKLVGNYIKAGIYFRKRFFIIIATICVGVFPIFFAKHHLSLLVSGLLLVSIISDLFFNGLTSYYRPILQIHQKISKIYQIEIIGNLLRFLIIVLLYTSTGINSWMVVLAGSLAIIVSGFLYKRESAIYIEEPSETSSKAKREMLHYISPLIPSTIDYAFQGHITIFIISIFGATRNIAEISALGRLGQLFLLLNAVGPILIAPYIAKQSSHGLFKKYFSIIILSVAIALFLTIASFVFPQPLLWIIGEKYYHLKSEIGFLILNGSLGFINGILWQMNASRKWIWWWMPVLSIPGAIFIQIMCIIYMDLSSTHNVIIFSLITSIFILLTRIIVAVCGFYKAHKLTFA